jgi:Mn2+/Fe2+ NRAMP family transporter
MDNIPAKYPEIPAGLKDKSLLGALKLFGPGAVIACVTIGSGETVFASRGGAIFGYSLMWCFVLGAAIKFVQVYSGARFLTLTGRHPLESWAHLPGPRGWFVWLIALLTILCMPLFLGAGLPRILGDFTNWIFSIPEGLPGSVENAQFGFYARVWGTLYILMAIVLTFLQSYGFLEKVQTAIVGLLLFCMLVAVAASSPDVMAILSGTFVPKVPTYEPWAAALPALRDRSELVEVVVYIGVIGGGTQDYFGYLGMLREKGWGMMSRITSLTRKDPIDSSAQNLAVGKRWLKAPKIDVSVSFAAIVMFTVCFAVLGAALLHPEQRVPKGNALLTEQASFLVREGQGAFVQMFLSIVYKTGIFLAFFGTIHGAYELYTRTTRECLIAALPRLRETPLRVFRLWTILACGIVGLTLLWWSELDPVAVITPASIVSSTFACGLWCFAMLWTDRVHLPKGLRMNWGFKACLVIAGIALTVFGAVAFYLAYFAG